MGLLDVVKAVKPNILIGLSTCGGLFSGMTQALQECTKRVEYI